MSYGYVAPETNLGGSGGGAGFNFGLNAGAARLTKFEFNPNGGKGGAAQEALDIEFTINGKEKSYRMFPVTQAFGKNNEKITDPESEEMKLARSEFSQTVSSILLCFTAEAVIQQAMNQPIEDFKTYCNITAALLPANFSEKPLDIFVQYGYKLGAGATQTYLEIPKNNKHGKWVMPAVVPVGGTWTEHRNPAPKDTDEEALYYADGAGNKHPFTRSGWFVNSNFANQQKAATASNVQNAATAAPTGTVAGSPAAKSGW